MILRRITEHVKAQNWLAVAIDFVIVVVGVFIGIQVSNWNAARVDDGRARSYLERIRGDLEADIANYENRIAFWRKVADYGAAGLRFAETGGEAEWPLVLAYFQASQVAEFYTTAATFEELKSAGELHLIGDLAVRERLAQYYTNAGNPAMTERPRYREHVRGIIPLDVQSYIWTNCWRSNEFGDQDFVDCASPVDEVRAAAIANSISKDAALMSELRYWMSTMQVASQIGLDRTGSAKSLHALVEAQLDGR